MRMLTGEEIRAGLRGVAAVEQTSAGLRLFRCSAADTAYYDTDPALAGRLSGMGVRAMATSGVALEFVTDSPVIRLEAWIGDGVLFDACFDLLVDGMMTAYARAPRDSGAFSHDFPGPGRLRHVRLCWPHYCWAALRGVGVAAGCRLDVAPHYPVLLAYGDSITHGQSAGHPSLTYAATAARRLGYTLHNCGVGCGTFDVGALQAAATDDPELITVALGINDWTWGQPAAAAGRWLRRLRELYPVAPLFLLEPLWHPAGDGRGEPNAAGVTLPEYRQELLRVAAEQPRLRVVSHTDLLPAGDDFLPDGVHPSAEGMLVMGHNLAMAVLAT